MVWDLNDKGVKVFVNYCLILKGKILKDRLCLTNLSVVFYICNPSTQEAEA